MLPARDGGSSATQWLGKGIPVQAGRWIGEGIARSLAGDPGPVMGKPLGDRESVITVKRAWSKPGVLAGQTTMFR
jgi:hypothetical protein